MGRRLRLRHDNRLPVRQNPPPLLLRHFPYLRLHHRLRYPPISAQESQPGVRSALPCHHGNVQRSTSHRKGHPLKHSSILNLQNLTIPAPP